jgi:hypothetical protein
MAGKLNMMAGEIENPVDITSDGAGLADLGDTDSLISELMSTRAALNCDDSLSIEEQETTGEIGIEIIPPLDISVIMNVIEYLESLPQVKGVELLSRVEKPLIIIYLKKPMDIIKTLESVADIDEVTESKESGQTRQTVVIRTRVADSKF